MYSGIGTGSYSSALPPQAIPLHKKGPKWQKANMDRLEEIGLQQLKYNWKFNDLYSMVEGNLAATDYERPPDSMQAITDMMETAEIPAYVRHFDVLGQLANHLAGKYNDVKDKFRVDFLDPISRNEFGRELTNRLHDFSQKAFKIELDATMLRAGLDIDKQFNSQEEQEKYLQYLEQQKQQLATPPQINEAMKRDWKPLAAKWAEMMLEKEMLKPEAPVTDHKLFIDKFLTGRWFKHYRIGYDYFRSERWSPITTFFSQDLEIEYPQNGEYVGRIHEMSPSDIINTYGYMIKESDQKKLLNAFDYDKGSSSGDEPSFEKMMKSNFVELENTPGEDYYDRETNVALQEMFGRPLGEETYINSNGEQVTRPAWIPSYHDNPVGISKLGGIRRDINVRKDLIRVTEAYWRSFERIGSLYYETESGMMVKEIVTDEILEGFLEEHGITKLNKISLAELEIKEKTGELEPNTICFTYAPRVYKGVKVCATQGYLKDDLYLGVEPMPFQIKGESNLYDVQLPVTGLITNAEATKLRQYQIEYNYQMNLMHSLTEKEIGMFFLFDINFLTSDFAEMGDSKEALLNMIDMARDVGMVPIDGSKQNLREKQGVQYNTMMSQDISFVPQIQQKMQMAEYYKRLMLEQIGVTAQDMGTPDQYMTAEGVKMGNQNSFNQIEHIFQKMDAAALKDMETYLTVAQYCQTNDKDISAEYTNSDGVIQLLNFSDEWFHLRKLGLMPIMDGSKRKSLETFKQYLLNTNTLSNDVSDIASVLSSKSMTETIALLKQSQMERQKDVDAQRAHEQQLMQTEAQKELALDKANKDFISDENKLDRDIKVDVARLNAVGKASDSNATFDAMEYINDTADKVEQQNNVEKGFDIKNKEIDRKKQMDTKKLSLEEEKLEIEREKNRLKELAIKSNNFTSVINKN
jgi:hypothetical protein